MNVIHYYTARGLAVSGFGREFSSLKSRIQASDKPASTAKNICQLGAHGTEEFTCSQAKAVLGMTMALLAEPTVGCAPGHELIEEDH